MPNTRTFLLAFLLVLSCTTLAFQCTYSQKVNGRHTNSTVDDDSFHIIQSDDTRRLEVRGEGDIELTPGETGIERISQGGYLQIEQETRGEVRRLEITPAEDGSLDYTYAIDGRSRPFDTEAKDWLANLFPTIIRETGINAEERVERILKEEGVDGVLREIDLIDSSSIRRMYYTHLVVQGELGTQDLRRVTRRVADDIPSSGDKKQFLIDVSGYYLNNDATYSAYFDAVGSIASSGDHMRVLRHVLQEHTLDQRALTHLLESARGIASSGDRARLLLEAAPHYTDDSNLRAAFFEAIDSLPSSGDHSRVLLTLLDEHDLSEAALVTLLQSTREIASSGDRMRVLRSAAEQYVSETTLREAYFDAVNTIPSSGDHARVLMALLDRDDLDKPTMLSLLESAGEISSSGDKARVLLEVADRVGDDDELVDAYLETAETISSSSTRSRVLSALIEENRGSR